MSPHDPSLTQDLERWACESVAAPAGVAHRFTMVSGDASFRQYYRLTIGDASYVAVSAPPEKEDNAAFVAVRELLADGGVCVPELLDYDAARGFLLLSDFGDTLLLSRLDDDTVDDWYHRACDTLLGLQRIDPASLPPYDRNALATEMRLFDEWFVARLLAVEPGGETAAILEELRERLIESALAQPQVVVHRDYHSRNLMVLPDNGLGVIDFQDARSGPITYDLVSLLRDCYIQWPEARVAGWALDHRDRLQDAGLIEPTDDARFLRWFDLMGLQRHLKVLGIFARLHLRDGKSAYLNDLPLVIHYTLSVAQRYPEGAALVAFFERDLMPLVREQPWWQPL